LGSIQEYEHWNVNERFVAKLLLCDEEQEMIFNVVVVLWRGAVMTAVS